MPKVSGTKPCIYICPWVCTFELSSHLEDILLFKRIHLEYGSSDSRADERRV